MFIVISSHINTSGKAFSRFAVDSNNVVQTFVREKDARREADIIAANRNTESALVVFIPEPIA